MASDDFTDSDGTGLESHDSNWTSVDATYNVEALEINSNRCEHEGNWDISGAYYNESTEDSSEIDFIATSGGSDKRRVSVRMGSNERGYSCHLGAIVSDNYTECYIQKSGVWLATLEDAGSWSVNSDHTVKVTASGTTTVTIEGFVNDVSQGTAEDGSSPLGSGHPGFYCIEAQQPRLSTFDNWTDGAAGNLTINVNDSLTHAQALD